MWNKISGYSRGGAAPGVFCIGLYEDIEIDIKKDIDNAVGLWYTVGEDYSRTGEGWMAAFVFGGGVRAQALAEEVLRFTPDAEAEYGVNECGVQVIVKIRAACLQMTRRMVEETQFDGDPEYSENTDRLLHYYAMHAEGKILRLDGGRIIVADDDGDKLMSLRCKVYHRELIRHLSARIGVSGNDFILKAIEYYSTYLMEAEEAMQESDAVRQ